MDFQRFNQPHAPASPGELRFARIFGSIFIIIWIVGAFSITRAGARIGPPGMWSFVGYGMCLLGVLLLIRLLTWKPDRNPAASAAGSHHGPAVIHQHFAAPAPLPPPVPTVCDACGARRVARETTCRYCGGALL